MVDLMEVREELFSCLVILQRTLDVDGDRSSATARELTQSAPVAIATADTTVRNTAEISD